MLPGEDAFLFSPKTFILKKKRLHCRWRVLVLSVLGVINQGLTDRNTGIDLGQAGVCSKNTSGAPNVRLAFHLA